MAGAIVGINLPTFFTIAASVAARNAEYTGDPLTDTGAGTAADPWLGCNTAGSNAPGIGICTGIIKAYVGDTLDPAKWTLEDQFEAARAPQNSQYIGGDGLDDGDATVFEPITAWDYANADFNNTLAFLTADAAVATDGIYETVEGAINRTPITTTIGDVLWGTIPVA